MLGVRIIICYALLILNAGQMKFLTSESATQMPAWMNSVAGFWNFLYALVFATALLKGQILVVVLLFYFLVAEATFDCNLVTLGFFASHTHVVRRSKTFCTKVGSALPATHSKAGHVVCC